MRGISRLGARDARAEPDPALWGLERREGRLWMDGCDLVALAHEHGTPLYVASARILRERAAEFRAAFASWRRPVHVHFSYKTNQVAGVLRVLHDAGLGAEVVDGWELWLARRLGLPPERVVMNGPNKLPGEIEEAVGAGIGLLVVDGLAELDRVEAAAARLGRRADVALRICPDVVPRGMNASSLTGSRKNQFGMDPDTEAPRAIQRAARSPHLRLRGPMAHIGSGIHDLDGFRLAVDRLLDVLLAMRRADAAPDLLDLGGGLGTRRSREFTTREMLWYLGTGRLPRLPPPSPPDLFARYGETVCDALEAGCRARGIEAPALILEPGRAITSDSEVLLLEVGAVRERPGVGRFALTDGGAMTVSMMFLSEHHAVTLANREAPVDGTTSVFGRLPSPMDVVYRRLPTPRLAPGDLLCILDAGAYFTSTATNFGGPRPAVLLIDDGRARVTRRRETPEDLARVEEDLDGPRASP